MSQRPESSPPNSAKRDPSSSIASPRDLNSLHGSKPTSQEKNHESFKRDPPRSVSKGGSSSSTDGALPDHVAGVGHAHIWNSPDDVTGVGHAHIRDGPDDVAGVGDGPDDVAGVGHAHIRTGPEGVAGVGHAHIRDSSDDVTGVDHAHIRNGSEAVAGVGHAHIHNGPDDVIGVDHAHIRNGSESVAGVYYAHIHNSPDEVADVGYAHIHNGPEDVAGVDHAHIRKSPDEVAGAGVGHAHIHNGPDEVTGVVHAHIRNGPDEVVGVGYAHIRSGPEDVAGVEHTYIRTGRGRANTRHPGQRSHSQPPCTPVTLAERILAFWDPSTMNQNQSLRTSQSSDGSDDKIGTGRQISQRDIATGDGDAAVDANRRRRSSQTDSARRKPFIPDQTVTTHAESNGDQLMITAKISPSRDEKECGRGASGDENRALDDTPTTSIQRDSAKHSVMLSSSAVSAAPGNDMRSEENPLAIGTDCMASVSLSSFAGHDRATPKIGRVGDKSEDAEDILRHKAIDGRLKVNQMKPRETAESADKAPDCVNILFSYGRGIENVSNIKKDEMIFEVPKVKVDTTLFLGRSKAESDASIKNSEYECNRNHINLSEDSETKTSGVTSDSAFNFHSTAIDSEEQRDRNIQSRHEHIARDENVRVQVSEDHHGTQTPSGLMTGCTLDASCIDCNTDRFSPGYLNFDPSLSTTVKTTACNDLSLSDSQCKGSALREKKNKVKSRKKRVLFCRRCRRMSRRYVRSSKHRRASKGNFQSGSSTAELAPYIPESRGKIVYEKKDGKYFCRGVRQKTPAQNINSNSGEVKTEAKASSFIGEYLFELWKNQCLCDVKIQSPGSCLFAHKIVLAAFSDVFCPKEPLPQPSLHVNVPDTTGDAVYQVLLYLYTSEMELSDDTLEDVLNAAIFLGVMDVVDLIKDILLNPTKDNFLKYLDVAARLNLPITLMHMPHLVRDNLTDVWDSQPFKELTADEMITVLSDQELMINSESEVLVAVCKWAEHNFPKRVCEIITLLQYVNFVCIEPEVLSEIVEKYEQIFDHKDLQQVLAHIYKSYAVNCIEAGHMTGALGDKHCSNKRRTLNAPEHHDSVCHNLDSTDPLVHQSSQTHDVKKRRHCDGSFESLLEIEKETYQHQKTSQVTKDTIKSINEQFQRFFGPDRTADQSECYSRSHRLPPPIARNGTQNSIANKCSPRNQTAIACKPAPCPNQGSVSKPPSLPPPSLPPSLPPPSLPPPSLPPPSLPPPTPPLASPHIDVDMEMGFPRSRTRPEAYNQKCIKSTSKHSVAGSVLHSNGYRAHKTASNIRDRYLASHGHKDTCMVDASASRMLHGLDSLERLKACESKEVGSTNDHRGFGGEGYVPLDHKMDSREGRERLQPNCSRLIQRRLLCPCLEDADNKSTNPRDRSLCHRLRFNSCDRSGDTRHGSLYGKPI